MSTRCNVVIKDNDATKYVYHHCDGYLSGVGSELKEFLRDQYKPFNFTAEELRVQLNKWDQSYEIDDSGIHGDIEYLYTIEICKDHSILITAEELDWKTDSWKKIIDYTEAILPSDLKVEEVDKSADKKFHLVHFYRIDGFNNECLAVLAMFGKDEGDIKSQLIGAFKDWKFPDKINIFSSAWNKTEITKVIKRFAEEGCPQKIKDDLGELYENKPGVFQMTMFEAGKGGLIWDKQLGF